MILKYAVLCFLFLLLGACASTGMQPTEVIQTKWEPVTFTWDGGPADAEYPVGTWSDPFPIRERCGLRHDEKGCGIEYLLEYHFNGEDWVQHKPNVKAKASEIRVKVLTGGLRRIPLLVSCDK